MRPTKLWVIRKRRKIMTSSVLPKGVRSEEGVETHSIMDEVDHPLIVAEHQAMRIFSRDSDEVLSRQEDSHSISETSSVDERHDEDHRSKHRTLKMRR